MAGAKNLASFPHPLPHLERRCIHVKQAQLLRSAAPRGVDADRPKQFHLPGTNQRGPDAYRWRIFDILNFVCALGDNRVVDGPTFRLTAGARRLIASSFDAQIRA